ncbi:MAG: redoxin domain-containing protein [Tenuifilaceae bacterium]
MKYYKLILVLIFTISLSCSNNKKQCFLVGDLKNVEGRTYLYLKDLQEDKLVDSILVRNGKFKIKLEIDHPKEFLIHNKRNQFEFRDSKTIWLEPANVNISGDFNFLKNLKINGSESNLIYETYQKMLDSLKTKITSTWQSMDLEKNTETKEIIQKKYDSLKVLIPKKVLMNLLTNSNSYVTLSILYKECYFAFRHLSKKEISQVYDKLPDSLKNTSLGTDILKYINLPGIPNVGEQAYEIAQSNPENKLIKLSDFKGKYVLVEFWSSSCGPCRMSNKEMRKIYDKYKNSNFEILGVAGDNKKEDWIKAIATDSITWPNISDLKGWHNEAFLVYDITNKGIPYNILIDPKGTIIREALCSPIALEKEMKKILEDKNGL